MLGGYAARVVDLHADVSAPGRPSCRVRAGMGFQRCHCEASAPNTTYPRASVGAPADGTYRLLCLSSVNADQDGSAIEVSRYLYLGSAIYLCAVHSNPDAYPTGKNFYGIDLR